MDEKCKLCGAKVDRFVYHVSDPDKYHRFIDICWDCFESYERWYNRRKTRGKSKRK